MASNSFGALFRFTTWGESHGAAIGVVVDGCPALIPLIETDIQPWLDRRRPGQSKFTTQRQEADQVKILSGTFEGVTTGAPISLLIENTDARSKDYDDTKDKFRPGHADYTYQVKYGIRDHRGGGRSSARETACRVAVGGIARKILGSTIQVRGAVIQIGTKKIDRAKWDWAEIGNNPFFCPDKTAVKELEEYLENIRKNGSSAGAIIEVIASGVPAGLGDPIYGKLDSELARAMMSINAVKGVEIGDGFAAAELTGEQNADDMRAGTNGKPAFLSNHAGGILGGISTGQDIVVRFAVKPTSSILQPKQTIDKQGNNTEIVTKGRHDPCVGIRAVPVGEAMMACVLADRLLESESLEAMIIVTGGAGFIGSNLVAALDARGERVVVCDRLGHDDKWRNIAKRDLEAVIAPERLAGFLEQHTGDIEAIFHMGAISTTTESNVDLIVDTNFRLSRDLWLWCKENSAPFIYASSAATYGDGTAGFKDDDSVEALAKLKPLNPYGWSKHLFDRWVARQKTRKKGGPSQSVGLKFFNVYGPNEYHKGGQRSVADQIYPFAARGEAFALFKSHNPTYADGGQLRDFVWVGDCVKVMLWLFEHPKINGLFNLGSGTARSFKDLADAVYKAAEKEPIIAYREMPENLCNKYQYFTEADMSKLRTAGYTTPFASIEEGVRVYVRDYLATEDRYV